MRENKAQILLIIQETITIIIIKGHGAGKHSGWVENIWFKLYIFTLQLAVVTARMFTMELFIDFYFEFGLNKGIQISAEFKARFWDILKRLMF